MYNTSELSRATLNQYKPNAENIDYLVKAEVQTDLQLFSYDNGESNELLQPYSIGNRLNLKEQISIGVEKHLAKGR
jgi:hypothetical protein